MNRNRTPRHEPEVLRAQANAMLAAIFSGRRGDAAAPANPDPTTKGPAPAAAVARELTEA